MAFAFETTLQTAMNGIDSAGSTAGVVSISQYVLTASLLWAVYQAWTKGGDVQALGAAAIKFFSIGLILINFGSVFRDVNGAFNSVAGFIDSNGAHGVDVFTQWSNDLGTYWSQNGVASLWDLMTGALTGLLNGLLLLIGYLIFPISFAIFSLFYALYGSVLYLTGPLVLALYPSGFGGLARKYIVNLVIFNSWSVIYSIFGALLTAINLNTVNDVLNAQNFAGAFNGVGGALLLGLSSILLSICIALIPLIAKRIVEGDVGATAGTVIRTATTAAVGVVNLFKGGL